MSIVCNDYTYISFKDNVEREIEKSKQSVFSPRYAVSYEDEACKLLEQFNREMPGVLNNVITSYQASILKELSESNGKRITYHEKPSLYTNIIENAERLNVAKPMMYLDYVKSLNAMALGTDEKFLLVIGVKIADSENFTNKEQSFIIGHELGHQQCNHTISLILINKNSEFFKYVKKFIPQSKKLQNAVRDPMQASRRMEISADRAGLLCCADLRSAVSALIKLHENSNDKKENYNITQGQVDDYISEAEEKVNDLREDTYTHPSLLRRIYALKLFYESRMFNELTKNKNSTSSLNLLSDDELNEAIDLIFY